VIHLKLYLTNITAETIAVSQNIVTTEDAQIPSAGSSQGLNFVWWKILFVSPWYGTCFLSKYFLHGMVFKSSLYITLNVMPITVSCGGIVAEKL